jgi:hypothetical protein
MIQTILIVLVAVVVLIVIIAVLALRYLRADDSDSFDDVPDEPRPARRPAEPDRERVAAPSGRRPRQPEQVTEAWAADRPTRSPDTSGPAGVRDRDTAARRTGPQRAAGAPAVRRDAPSSRPARVGARPDGPDASTSSWDALSDVDYWAELAADKPEITPAAGTPVSTRRHGSEPVSDLRPAAGRSAGRQDSGDLPSRERHQQSSRPAQPPQLPQPPRPVGASPARTADARHTEQIDLRPAQPATARYNGDGAASSPDVPGRHGKLRHPTSQRPSGGQRQAGPRQAPSAPAAQPAYQSPPPAPAGHAALNGNGRGPADDDPLTSPSFPAVHAADSRSYRTRRSSEPSQAGASGPHARPAAPQGTTSHQFIEYSSAPRRTASQPNGYPEQQTGTRGQPAAQPPGPQPQAAQAANPYGSYVSQPQPAHSDSGAQNGYSSAGYPEAPAPSLAAAAYSGHAAGQQSAAAGWYAGAPVAATSAQPTDGYLPADGLGGNGRRGGSHARNGSQTRGYAGIDYTSLRYDDPVYPDEPAALPGYGASGQHAAQPDQRGYAGPDSGQDGYPAYPGYGTGVR